MDEIHTAVGSNANVDPIEVDIVHRRHWVNSLKFDKIMQA